MKHILSLILVCVFDYSYSQINFQNPEFTSRYSVNYLGVTPRDWDACSETPDTNPNPVQPDYFAQSGNSCVGIAANYAPNWPPPIFVESIGQVLQQDLLAGQTYYFLAWVNRPRRYQPCCGSFHCQFKVLVGTGQCDSTYLVYTSPYIDSVWTQIPIEFKVPARSNNIVFRMVLPNDRFNAYVMLDNLSPIYTGPYTGLTSPTPPEDGLMVYPNPTNDGLVHLSISPDLQLGGAKVFDLMGRQVPSALNGNMLDISGLPGGVYFLELRALSSEGSEVVKRVKVIKN